MRSTVVKPQPTAEVGDGNPPEDHEGAEEGEGRVILSGVTSHVCIRPGDTAGTLDKEAVLRQIRQRKRMNRLRGAIHGLFGLSGPDSNKDDKSNGRPKSVCVVKWVDDAFAAP
ncbi:unnamed protein product [Linum tenue]|uniref:Uncharacterized protein n=1 Tax=Linum tenue TaxID=586396 RepID=A0AAV0P498_9ROSI|nr:unnamed protein product [Linum tenue]